MGDPIPEVEIDPNSEFELPIWRDEQVMAPYIPTEPAFPRAKKPASRTSSAETMLRQGAVEGLPADIYIELAAGNGEVERHSSIE